ncbi:3'(2'),5'-bisphosphate nucleotidase CysQ [Patiriisocius marinistellae]|uniref:3'(2'),5'-bisphosphate nucleotidase CysQ n=1 Tax=Patiriisocius marinistellae TaxID=2494560 RepID=A0A5J4G329_9FLAO|nr:3'(2'),5'-bisphosphate nucleotidase CysQ [Patiriisocius marinistellae]GEQ87216.1 3'(2'),5'-bisphosphate nucleotidase CysQ [Patiriisocius marinistellae]
MQQLLETAIKAAIDGGKAILKIYVTDFEVLSKDDASPLTQADKNANDIINRYLVDTKIPIISEENKQLAYEERKDWSRCWIVDPLDGTKEFVKRNGEFTVNIALVENGNPILGVIYVPVTKELYYTTADARNAMKATLVSEEEDTIESILNNAEIISPSEISVDENFVIKIVGSRSHLNDETKQFISEIEKNNTVEIVSKGSSLKFCLVAEGAAHIYPRYAPTMEWDTAAGQAICQAADVQVIDNETKTPLKYNKENLLNPYFLVKK